MNTTIKQAIEDMYPYLPNTTENAYNNTLREIKRDAAESGYSLAEQEKVIMQGMLDSRMSAYELLQEEITRLKELIELAYRAGEKRKTWIYHGQGLPPIPPDLQQFKANNQL